MDFTNAGHNPPVIGTNVKGEFLPMESNAPIGLWPGIEYVGESYENIKGHSSLVYSDGLNEAENTEQEQFSDERILEVLSRTNYTTSKEVIDALVEEVEKHRNGADPNDDLTMLCLRIK
jgi:serine phosphatase RsbU (regulator of sigma subunit)